jgi:hypothetical protein
MPEIEITINQIFSRDKAFTETMHDRLGEVGSEFGLFETMSRCGPITAECLATQVGIPAQYARLWLDFQAAGNVLKCQKNTGLYSLWTSTWTIG